MACIDKTYVNKEELKEVINWCLSVDKLPLENGDIVRPIKMISVYLDDDYNPVDDQEEYILWNTPSCFDRLLWLYCPLDFIRDRLQYQYSEETLKEFEHFVYKCPNDNPNLGKQKYTFLFEPKYRQWKWDANNAYRAMYEKRTKIQRRNRWFPQMKWLPITMKIQYNGNNMCYDSTKDCWYDEDTGSMMACGEEFEWYRYHDRTPNRKSIIRELRRHWLPSGAIVEMKSRIKGLEWKILVK